MENQLGLDLVSNLPVGIIENILTFLPIRDAIRTSILSTKWRHKWTSLPRLVFDDYGMGSLFLYTSCEKRVKIREKRLKVFVTRTLFRHEGPIHKFKLSVDGMDSCSETDQWLIFLSRKDIKELIIQTGSECFKLPSCLYSCSNLTLLELECCVFGPPPPTFKGFLFLRSLILRDVEASSATVETLVANSPLLENLECRNAGLPELRISAPNLKYFYIGSSYKEIHLCAPLLAKMIVKFNEGTVYRAKLLGHNHSVCNYTKFLDGVINLESLTGDRSFTKYLSTGIEYRHHPLVFHHLKVITLGVNFHNVNETLVVVSLIRDAVNLHELQIKFHQSYKDDQVEAHVHLWDSECLQNCTLKKLKTIKMTSFCGSHHEMKFIQFLLESSPVLETMIVKPDQSYSTKQNIVNLIVELLTYRRVSANAKIFYQNEG